MAMSEKLFEFVAFLEVGWNLDGRDSWDGGGGNNKIIAWYDWWGKIANFVLNLFMALVDDEIKKKDTKDKNVNQSVKFGRLTFTPLNLEKCSDWC